MVHTMHLLEAEIRQAKERRNFIGTGADSELDLFVERKLESYKALRSRLNNEGKAESLSESGRT